jgi:hypothetical protein
METSTHNACFIDEYLWFLARNKGRLYYNPYYMLCFFERQSGATYARTNNAHQRIAEYERNTNV